MEALTPQGVGASTLPVAPVLAPADLAAGASIWVEKSVPGADTWPIVPDIRI